MWPFKKKKKTLQEAIMEDAFAEEHFPVETGELPAENSADEELGLDDIMKEFSMGKILKAIHADDAPLVMGPGQDR